MKPQPTVPAYRPRKPRLARALSGLLAPWEKLISWTFGVDYNPTYQSGVLAVFLLAVVVVTGVPLLLFYRVGSPYESLRGMQGQVILSWLRSLHRYASDAAVVAVAFHALRMLLGGRTSGPRTRAWLSGLSLTALMVVIGVLGLIMVWDEQAQRLAMGGIRFLEGLPIFSEPPRRIFADNSTLGESFFFMLIFLHVALPLVLTFMLIFHTSRMARAQLWPQSHLCKFYGLALAILALAWPASLATPADLLHLPGVVPLDIFYAFWLPPLEHFGPVWTLTGLSLLTLGLGSIPWWWALGQAPLVAQASVVDESSCTGCTQCFQDCPYDAIQMVPRTHSADERHSELVARVDTDLCVSCGICAGSCAPMGVGPPLRTGRDQLSAVEKFAASVEWKAGDVVVLACRWGTGESDRWNVPGLHLYPTGCSGSLHTSVLEMLLRRGASGVMVISCPERDCSHREGPKWLRLRVYEDREAELQPRVDRKRVQVLACPGVEVEEALRAAKAFREEVLQLGSPLLGAVQGLRCRTQEVQVDVG